MKEINNNLQKENNSLNQKKENEILQISNSFNEQLEQTSQKLLEMSKTIEKNKTTIQLLMNKINTEETKTRIFGSVFVKNNRSRCKIIYNSKIILLSFEFCYICKIIIYFI